jgi:hypothetical protein
MILKRGFQIIRPLIQPLRDRPHLFGPGAQTFHLVHNQSFLS